MERRPADLPWGLSWEKWTRGRETSWEIKGNTEREASSIPPWTVNLGETQHLTASVCTKGRMDFHEDHSALEGRADKQGWSNPESTEVLGRVLQKGLGIGTGILTCHTHTRSTCYSNYDSHYHYDQSLQMGKLRHKEVALCKSRLSLKGKSAP